MIMCNVLLTWFTILLQMQDRLAVFMCNLKPARMRGIMSQGTITCNTFTWFIILLQMQDRLAVFMCNLKPAKMRGVMSQGMIMCASSPEKVEILLPPPGSQIGDRVFAKDYQGKHFFIFHL